MDRGAWWVTAYGAAKELDRTERLNNCPVSGALRTTWLMETQLDCLFQFGGGAVYLSDNNLRGKSTCQRYKRFQADTKGK